MDFYRIVGPECGRDRYGDFECICGHCEKLPEGSTHDEVVGHPSGGTTAHREDDDILMSRIAMLEERAEYLKQRCDSTSHDLSRALLIQAIFAASVALHLILEVLGE